MNAAIDTAETYSTFLEIQISEGAAKFRPVAQQAITVTSVVRDTSGAASLPVPAASYPTWEQARATFMQLDPVDAQRNGRGFYLYNALGEKLYCWFSDTDKEFHTERVS